VGSYSVLAMRGKTLEFKHLLGLRVDLKGQPDWPSCLCYGTLRLGLRLPPFRFGCASVRLPAPVVRHGRLHDLGLSDALLQFLLLDGRQDHTSCSTPQRAISTR
jgi:hypothetical protein